ncbi:thyrotroph embryonic factor [Ctenocephalides felis]|uniref:thyrotroph embryonic factor n=1 Tax=Ctenocephalides felis TaxID=7515 RepID=UPI000E6E38AF|nr:thyrotroph embryonic factor [Ctenocephalides felis]
MSAFSALHLLRSYNHLFIPELSSYGTVLPLICQPNLQTDNNFNINQKCTEFSLLSPRDILADNQKINLNLKTDSYIIPPLVQSLDFNINLGDRLSSSRSCNSLQSPQTPRTRGEKRPIPEEQKDERYFERRKRNNRAAKKSRDARKMREDQIALRAAILEQENRLLRVQLFQAKQELAMAKEQLTQQQLFSHNHEQTI